MFTVQKRRVVSNQNPAAISRGGQASLGLFGCGSITGRPLRPFQALADDQARRLGGLSFGQRRARVAALIVPPAPAAIAPLANPPCMETLMTKYRRHPKAEPVFEEDTTTSKATPAMLAAAAASDAREAFAHVHDEEHADFLFNPHGAAAVEAMCALL